MMRSSTKILLIILFIEAVVFSGMRYYMLFNRLQITSSQLQESRLQARDESLKKMRALKELNETKVRLEQVSSELEHAKGQFDSLSRKLAGLKRVNQDILIEKEKLEKRLHSLTELKKAISEINAQQYQRILQDIQARKQMMKEIDSIKLKNGNQGFMVKNGESVYKSSIKIEVRPSN